MARSENTQPVCRRGYHLVCRCCAERATLAGDGSCLITGGTDASSANATAMAKVGAMVQARNEFLHLQDLQRVELLGPRHQEIMTNLEQKGSVRIPPVAGQFLPDSNRIRQKATTRFQVTRTPDSLTKGVAICPCMPPIAVWRIHRHRPGKSTK